MESFESLLMGVLDKIARQEQPGATALEELRLRARQIDRAEALINSWVRPGTTTPFIRNLESQNVFISSGEVRLGSPQPGAGFSGVRIAEPAITYNGETWNIVGVNNDTMQVGIRASDGKLIAGGGNVILDADGISFANDAQYLVFRDSSGDPTIYQSATSTDSFTIVNSNTGKAIRLQFQITSGAEFLQVQETGAGSDKTELYLTEGPNGARFFLGADGLSFFTAGDSGGQTYINIVETPITAPNPTANTDASIYVKGDKLIVVYNDGGTVRYKYLDLTGTGVTWTHTTTAP